MSRIILSKKQFELLEQIYNVNCSFVEEDFNKVYISADKDYYESVLDKISDELTEKGMDENFEPNDLGLLLEELIDIFSREVYK